MALKRIVPISALILLVVFCSVQPVAADFTDVALYGKTSGYAGDTINFTCIAKQCPGDWSAAGIAPGVTCMPKQNEVAVFYITPHAPGEFGGNHLTSTDANGQAQMPLKFDKPGEYTVGAAVAEGVKETTVQILPREEGGAGQPPSGGAGQQQGDDTYDGSGSSSGAVSGSDSNTGSNVDSSSGGLTGRQDIEAVLPVGTTPFIGSSGWMWVLAIIMAALLIAIVVVLVVTRRRPRREQYEPEERVYYRRRRRR